MKYTCAKSGFTITTPEFRHSLADNSHSVTHPIFSARPQLLLRAFDDFLAGRLNEQEIILLYLAIADSTGLLEWRTRFEYTEGCAGFLSTKLEALLKIATNITPLAKRGYDLPRFVISRTNESNTARGFTRLVSLWEAELKRIEQEDMHAVRNRALLRAEEHMERSVAVMRKRPQTYAKAVAQWAATVGEFAPAVSDIWQKIIVSCLLKDYRYHSTDIAQVLEFCEENVPAGSTHAFALFDGLRNAYLLRTHTFGVDRSAKFQSLISTADKEASAREVELLRAMRVGAPTEKPNRAHFANSFLFLRAMAAWNAAQKALPEPEDDSDFTITISPVAPIAPITGDNNEL